MAEGNVSPSFLSSHNMILPFVGWSIDDLTHSHDNELIGQDSIEAATYRKRSYDQPLLKHKLLTWDSNHSSLLPTLLPLHLLLVFPSALFLKLIAGVCVAGNME